MRPGLVLVQTFQPDAMPFQFAQRHDVTGFLAEELERRAVLGYPPYGHLVAIVVGRARGRRRSRRCCARCATGLDGVEATMLGPAPLLRLRGRHRAQLVAKTAEPRALARRAAALLAAASPDAAATRPDGRRRRRSPVALRPTAVDSPRHERARATITTTTTTTRHDHDHDGHDHEGHEHDDEADEAREQPPGGRSRSRRSASTATPCCG